MFTSRNWKDNVACVQPSFFLKTTRLRRLIYPDCGTDWWNKHQEDSYWREDYRKFFIYLHWLWSHWFITPCCFDHIRNDKCPNDSILICIMPFVAFCSFGFLGGKYSLENSSIGISAIWEIITYQQSYRDCKLTELVSPLPCMVLVSKLQSCVSGAH